MKGGSEWFRTARHPGNRWRFDSLARGTSPLEHRGSTAPEQGRIPRSILRRGLGSPPDLKYRDRLSCLLQLRMHTPQPRQSSSFSLAIFILGFSGSCAETGVIASTGQTLTHLPQPLQVSSLIVPRLIRFPGQWAQHPPRFSKSETCPSRLMGRRDPKA